MKKEYFYVLICYTLWGVLPAFWKLLAELNSVYVLALPHLLFFAAVYGHNAAAEESDTASPANLSRSQTAVALTGMFAAGHYQLGLLHTGSQHRACYRMQSGVFSKPDNHYSAGQDCVQRKTEPGTMVGHSAGLHRRDDPYRRVWRYPLLCPYSRRFICTL